MPKSKRQKEVFLSKTTKKDKSLKAKVVEDIQSCLEDFNHVYLFKVDNMRNKFLQRARSELKPGRIFMGKNKVMAKALGTTEEEEYRPGLAQLSNDLVGSVGILLTDMELSEIQEKFAELSELDYCRSGAKIDETIVVKEGPCYTNYGDALPHNMEPQLRKLGMPTRLVKGVVTLDRDFEICRANRPITPEQGQLLKLFQYPMAKFSLSFVGHWHNNQYDKLLESNVKDDSMSEAEF